MLPRASPHTPAMLVLSNLAFLLNSWSLSCSLRETRVNEEAPGSAPITPKE